MATSIRDYLGINSIGEKQNGEKMSHEEVYSTIVNAIGMDKCIHYLPETKHDILEAYKEDKHLNNIPLAKWDFAHSDFKF